MHVLHASTEREFETVFASLLQLPRNPITGIDEVIE
jgi:hypothetical protein